MRSQAAITLGLALLLLCAPAKGQQAVPRLPEPPQVTREGRVVQPPDLSGLPEVDDRESRGGARRLGGARTSRISMAPRAPARDVPLDAPGPLAIDPLAGRSYLRPRTAEAHVDFVPANPSVVLNARSLWDAMLSPPPPPTSGVAPRLRVASYWLFGVSGAALIGTLTTLGAQDPSPALRGLGYATLTTSLLSLSLGGVLLIVARRKLPGGDTAEP